MEKRSSLLAVVIAILVASLHTVNAHWTQTSVSTSSIARTIVVSGGNVFAGTSNGVYFSTNDGASWTSVNSGLNDTNINALYVNGGNIFAGTSHGVYLSTTNGASWTSIGLVNQSVGSLAFSGSNIFASTYDLDRRRDVYLSTNNGTSWTPVGLTSAFSLAANGSSIFAGDTNGYVYRSTNNGGIWNVVYAACKNDCGIAVRLSESGSNIFAIIGGYIKYTDSGANWTSISYSCLTKDSGAISSKICYPFPSYIYCLIVSGSNIFAGTSSTGIYFSTNNGISWATVDSGQINYRIGNSGEIISLAKSDSYLFAGTYGSGVWRIPLSEIVSVLPNKKQNISLQTKIHAIGSSALNSIILNYSIRFQCLVQLDIYTLAGQEVASLEKRMRDPGEYTVTFNTNTVLAEPYVYRFKAGDYMECGRILIIK